MRCTVKSRYTLALALFLSPSSLMAAPPAPTPKPSAPPGATETKADWRQAKVTFGTISMEGTAPSAFRHLNGRLTACYQTALRKQAVQQGKIDFELRLNAKGKVVQVSRQAEGLRDELVACAVAAAKVMVFEKPNGDGSTVLFSATFSVPMAPASAQPPANPYRGAARAVVGGAAVSGATVSDAASVLVRTRQSFQSCVDSARGFIWDAAGPVLGTVKLKLNVGPNGQVDNVSAEGGSLPQKLVGCISTAAKNLQFGAPKAAALIAVEVRVDKRQ